MDKKVYIETQDQMHLFKKNIYKKIIKKLGTKKVTKHTYFLELRIKYVIFFIFLQHMGGGNI